MADAIVEPRPTARFFCHRCSIEFEDVLQDYTCPYCAGGFIEQLESSSEGMGLSGDDFSDADMSNFEDISNLDDMSNLDDSEDHPFTPPMLNDLAFLMSGRRLRGNGNQQNAGGAPNAPNAPRRNTLMEELVWMIGGARPGTGAVTAGAPFVFVGAPGDYVFGGEGLDAVVTQLLGQLENAGPPPLPRERLAALPDEPVSEAQAAAGSACSVCWDNFSLGETVCRLECEHIFHSACIRPWLQLHATCPICRRSLLPPAPPPAPAAPTVTAPAATATAAATTATATATTPTSNAPAAPGAPTDSPTATIRTSIAAALPRILLRRIVHHPALRAPRAQPWPAAPAAPAARPAASDSSSASSASASTPSAASLLSDIERHYNMDLDMD